MGFKSCADSSLCAATTATTELRLNGTRTRAPIGGAPSGGAA